MSYVVILYGVFLLFTISLCTKKKSLEKSVLLIFLGWWTVLTALSTLPLYDMLPVSFQVYGLIFLHILCFTGGFLFSSQFKVKASPSAAKHLTKDVCADLLPNRKIRIITICILVPLTLYAIRYYLAVASQGIGMARLLRYHVGEVFHSIYEVLLFSYFGEFFFLVASVVLAYSIVFRKYKASLLIPILMGMILYCFIGLGRFEFIEAFCSFFVVWIVRRSIVPKSALPLENLYKRKLVRKHKNLYLLLFAVILLFALLVYTTAQRMGMTQLTEETLSKATCTTIQNIFSYITGPFRALDHALAYYKPILGMNFGRFTLSGIDELVGYFFRVFGIDYPISNYIYGNILQNGIIISTSGNSFNALYSALFNFYFDFGVIGVILFSFLFGFVINRSIHRFMSCKSFPNLVIVCLLFYTMVMLPIKWMLYAPSAIIGIVICLIWDTKVYQKALSFLQPCCTTLTCQKAEKDVKPYVSRSES